MTTRATSAPRLVVRDVRAGVRAVRLRLPFRFGAVTLEACPQLFVEADVEVEGCAGFATGQAAEMVVPRWFDKRADRTPEDNVRDLVASFERAAGAYRNDAPATAFGLHARHDAALMAADPDATALTRAYGAAVLDRAVLDATCRALGVSFFDLVKRNGVGLADDPLFADLAGFDWPRFLVGLQPRARIAVRHTVGMLDPLDGPPLAADGLPRSLPGAIAAGGLSRFKIKLGGDPVADARRLGDVLDVLDREAPGHRYTLDGNEQYDSLEPLAEFGRRLVELPAFRRRPDALDYIEQPIARDASLTVPIPPGLLPAPLLLDEGDAGFDAFPQAARLGWQGISSKTCKGLWKAIVNAARCGRWNGQTSPPGRYFLSGEDLTCQAGLSVQQDLALVSLLGLDHVERNGHHYGGAFGDAPDAEVRAFEAAHPALYTRGPDGTAPLRLSIRDGRLDLASLAQPGYASGARVDLAATRPPGDAPALAQVGAAPLSLAA